MANHFLILSEQPLLAAGASTLASRIDALFGFLVAVASFFVLLICTLILVFAVKYRHRPGEPRRPSTPRTHMGLELLWTGIPLAIVLIAFFWGAAVYVDYATPPADARTVHVVGKQWMWTILHPEGRKEINELHVPRGLPTRLMLASDDVIHSFYVPSFRVKQDALPGRYTSLWFQPTQTGRYRLFCAEYCGTNHSRMIGEIVVMEPSHFQDWLAGNTGETLSQRGQRLFVQLGCAACHSAESGQRGPRLSGLFGSTVRLQTGDTVLADEAYLRESILRPAAKIVAGYEPIMPVYAGQLNEETIFALIAHIRALGSEEDRL